MRFTNAQYLEKEVVTVSVRNNNSSVAIVDGTPVFFDDYNAATNFGVDVKRYSENAVGSYFAGIAKWSKLAGTSSNITGAAVGDVFEAVAYGFTDAIITRRTRAASTDNWASIASMAGGANLTPETVGNGLALGGGVVASLASDASVAAQTIVPVFVVLAESKASVASAASDGMVAAGLAAAALADTARMKVLVRTM